MNDGFGMRRLQGVSHLMPVLWHLLNVQRSSLDAVLQRLPFEKLHDDKALVLEFVDVVNRTNVWVVQGRCRSRLALKTFHGRMVLGKLLRKEFQADKAA